MELPLSLLRREASPDLQKVVFPFHPPTQENTALAVEDCVTLAATVTAIDVLCFGGFRQPADDPPKPWRRWVCLLGTTGLPVGLHNGIK